MIKTAMWFDDILDLEMQENDAGANTIKDYLKQLLATLWMEKAGFDGKRPFGNSIWQLELFTPLLKAGLIDGKFDEEGYIEKCDDETAEQIIAELIEYIFDR